MGAKWAQVPVGSDDDFTISFPAASACVQVVVLARAGFKSRRQGAVAGLIMVLRSLNTYSLASPEDNGMISDC